MSKKTAKDSSKVSNATVTELGKVLEKGRDDNDIDFINVCTPTEYREKHIEGVRNVPLDEIESHIDEFSEKKKIYVHCNSGQRSKKAIDTLQKQLPGVELVNVKGGLLAWEEAKYPTRSHTNRLPLMRQVMLAAGSLILIGFLLTLTASQWFLLVPLFVGVGLFISGSTGWCGMAMLLSKMPWNK